MKKLFLFLLLIFVTSGLNAQSAFPALDEISFDLKYCGGQIYKHTEKVHIQPPAYSQEIEFSFSHRTYGKRIWERMNNCPAPSVNICYSQYGDELGNAISLYPGIEWAVIRSKVMDWRFKIGGGIGLASERWTREDTLNNYLGSRLNNFTVIQTGANFKLNKKTELQIGGRMSHISNGAFRYPNFGINLFSGFVGINYYPVGIKQPKTQTSGKTYKRPVYLGLRSAIAFSEQTAANGPLSTIYSQTIYTATNLLNKHLIFVGADITYNNKALSSYKYAMLSDNLRWSSTNSTIFVGAELLYGKVGLPLQVGIFTKKLRNQTSNWYQKFGIHYYIYRKGEARFKNMYLAALLRSNKINADYIEFGVGFMF